MQLISIIIPVYNNELSLPVLYENLVREITNYPSPLDYQIIFINDCSKDKSLEVLIEINKKDKKVIVIDFSRNFGQMAGILAGWATATGDAVVNMSADLQDPPEQITKMIEQWEKGNEVVISYREAREDGFTWNLTSKIAYKLFSFSVANLPPGGFDFTLLGRKAMDAINTIKERNRFFQNDILWVGFNVSFIPYERQKRIHGKSGYNLVKRFGNFMTAFLNVSYFPIRIISVLGMITAFSGFAYALNIVYAYFFQQTPFAGWAPIMIILLIIGGLLMLMLGIIGEYIWRIYDEVKYRPNYIIKNKY